MSQGWMLQCDPDDDEALRNTIEKAAKTKAPSLFAVRHSIFDIEEDQDRGQLIDRLVQGHGVIKIRCLPAMPFDEWSEQHKRFERNPGLANSIQLNSIIQYNANLGAFSCSASPPPVTAMSPGR
jgi:hypothetical protein